MQVAIDIIEKMIVEDVPEKDGGGIYIPRNVDYGIRNAALRECIDKLKNHNDRA